MFLPRPVAPMPGKELAFLTKSDPDPRLLPFYTTVGDEFVPALSYRAGQNQPAIAKALQALRQVGWTVEFPIDKSLHAECRRGHERLQFFANWGPDAFLLYQDDRVRQNAWLTAIHNLTHLR
jgi:hypothetical protein